MKYSAKICKKAPALIEIMPRLSPDCVHHEITNFQGWFTHCFRHEVGFGRNALRPPVKIKLLKRVLDEVVSPFGRFKNDAYVFAKRPLHYALDALLKNAFHCLHQTYIGQQGRRGVRIPSRC